MQIMGSYFRDSEWKRKSFVCFLWRNEFLEYEEIVLKYLKEHSGNFKSGLQDFEYLLQIKNKILNY